MLFSSYLESWWSHKVWGSFLTNLLINTRQGEKAGKTEIQKFDYSRAKADTSVKSKNLLLSFSRKRYLPHYSVFWVTVLVSMFIDVNLEQWPSGSCARFTIQGSHVQNHWVAPRLTQFSSFPRPENEFRDFWELSGKK